MNAIALRQDQVYSLLSHVFLRSGPLVHYYRQKTKEIVLIKISHEIKLKYYIYKLEINFGRIGL